MAFKECSLPEAAKPYKELLKRAGVKFYYDTESRNDRTTCEQSIDDFFTYVRESPHRDNEFREMLQFPFRTGVNGGMKGNPHKNIVMGNLSDEDPQIRNHRDKFFWKGDPEILFRTLKELSKANLAPSGMYKHFPFIPLSNDSSPIMQTELKEYLRRYGTTMSQEQRNAVDTAIKQPENDTRIPLIRRGYWYKVSQDMPDDDIRNMAQFLKDNAENQWRGCISTNDIPAQKDVVERFKGENHDLADWADKIEFDSIEDYYDGPDIDDDLRNKLADARQTDVGCSQPNPQALSDRERILLLLGTQEQNSRNEAGGLYADGDTDIDVPVHMMRAPLGVQLAVIPKRKFEPADMNGVIAANGSPAAKKLLLGVLGRMLNGYGKNPNLNALVREPLFPVNPSPDLGIIENLRYAAAPKSIKELMMRVWKRESLDRSVLNHVNDNYSLRRPLVLLRGNQLMAMTTEMFGRHVLQQAPTAVCAIGRLWQTGRITPWMGEKWSGARERITPINVPEQRSGSSVSLATYAELPAKNPPRTLYTNLLQKTQQVLVPSRSAKRVGDKSQNTVSSSVVEVQTPAHEDEEASIDERQPLLEDSRRGGSFRGTSRTVLQWISGR